MIILLSYCTLFPLVFIMYFVDKSKHVAVIIQYLVYPKNLRNSLLEKVVVVTIQGKPAARPFIYLFSRRSDVYNPCK